MIAVGVDGSRAGLAAARWATREAVLRGMPLRVVHVMAGWAYEMPEGAFHAEVGRWMRECASGVVDEAASLILAAEPDLSVDSVVLGGDPRERLIAEAADAELLVVGNRGRGGFAGLLAGSVAYGIAGYATCPVVIVRELPSRPRGEVVVGVDGAPRGDLVIGAAFAEAALRGTVLRAVHAWAGDGLASTEAEVQVVAEALAGWSERYPDVRVRTDNVRGRPVEALAAASDGADLLVVGSHGHSELAGLLLGSVSRAMIEHARCPLIVVPSRAAQQGS